ncbi:MAG: electron transport complex subunit RsxA [Clostridia bacterium]|nr:electron transport complex subunit RsxA [Clostridia bacterium]
MGLIKDFLVLAITAMLVENFVLVKFMGICPFLGVSKKIETAAGMGIAVTFVMVAASALTWVVNKYVIAGAEYLQTISFILVIAALVQFAEMFVKKAVPALYAALGIYLPLITTNCAVLGVTMINVQRDYSFGTSLWYSFAAALGFMLAIVLFAGVRERLETAKIPKYLKGFPIALISAGLLSIAFLGFQGLSF